MADHLNLNVEDMAVAVKPSAIMLKTTELKTHQVLLSGYGSAPPSSGYGGRGGYEGSSYGGGDTIRNKVNTYNYANIVFIFVTHAYLRSAVPGSPGRLWRARSAIQSAVLLSAR
jgi:hypothetical protein